MGSPRARGDARDVGAEGGLATARGPTARESLHEIRAALRSELRDRGRVRRSERVAEAGDRRAGRTRLALEGRRAEVARDDARDEELRRRRRAERTNGEIDAAGLARDLPLFHSEAHRLELPRARATVGDLVRG
jgi:hypothetical protein